MEADRWEVAKKLQMQAQFWYAAKPTDRAERWKIFTGITESVEARIASLEADRDRLDWLDDRDNFYCITPATNRVGVAQGWTFSRKPLDFLNRIGERCADIREAIDAARAVSDNTSNGAGE